MKRISFVLMGLLLIFSCDNRARNLEDAMEDGYQMIDREEYDQAIRHFSNLMHENAHPHIKMALASAYAGRAGLHIDKFWEFIKAMRGEPINEETVVNRPLYIQSRSRVESIESYLPQEVLTNLESVFKVVTALDAYRDRVRSVPYAEPSKRDDIQRAVDVLTDINSPGGRLYRAVMNGVLIRSELEDGFDFWATIQEQFSRVLAYPLETLGIFCSPVVGDMTVWMDHQFVRSQMITDDLKVAFPSDQEQYESIGESIATYHLEVPQIRSAFLPGGCSE